MPRRDTAVTGAPCWVDLTTSDTERSREFYGQLFGWIAEEPAEQFGGYFNFRKAGVLVAGCMPNQGSEMPDLWSVYLATDDARKAVDATTTHSGQVLVEAMDVADLGTMASSATLVAPQSASGNPAATRASGSSTSPARRAGSSCTPATTRAPSPSTARCSAGIPMS